MTEISAPFAPTNGLQNRHIAMWQSHGWYYEAKLNRWEWQRARIFQTVEDLYTQSYVLPFLVPMLENSGANVLLPRERDWQTAEVIVIMTVIYGITPSMKKRTEARLGSRETHPVLPIFVPAMLILRIPLRKGVSVCGNREERGRKSG